MWWCHVSILWFLALSAFLAARFGPRSGSRLATLNLEDLLVGIDSALGDLLRAVGFEVIDSGLGDLLRAEGFELRFADPEGML